MALAEDAHHRAGFVGDGPANEVQALDVWAAGRQVQPGRDLISDVPGMLACALERFTFERARPRENPVISCRI
jgi:hypothetical protein